MEIAPLSGRPDHFDLAVVEPCLFQIAPHRVLVRELGGGTASVPLRARSRRCGTRGVKRIPQEEIDFHRLRCAGRCGRFRPGNSDRSKSVNEFTILSFFPRPEARGKTPVLNDRAIPARIPGRSARLLRRPTRHAGEGRRGRLEFLTLFEIFFLDRRTLFGENVFAFR